MRTIFVLFDSLNRSALGAYGSTALATPNFSRFAERALVFDRHYVGSMPCIPARRDMHTGRLNFLHRSWGPLEPFDNSFARELSARGVYTHIVTDHLHYAEVGGTGYVNAFDSWQMIRGQEYDPLKAVVTPPINALREQFDPRHYPFENLPEGRNVTRHNVSETEWRRSRGALNHLTLDEQGEEAWSTVKCFDEALAFLDTNSASDDWFLQIECFDPHEPFNAPERFRQSTGAGKTDRILDWPVYEKVTSSDAEIAETRANYAALVAHCDDQFGRLLDWLDETDGWDDTCVIVTTDHGFLLGEHEWWGKNKMPLYEEISHIPLMIRHPECKPGRYSGLTQTTDLMPTILELHGAPIPPEVRAHSLLPALQGEDVGRETAILGMFAGPICVTDGRFTYYLYPTDETASGLGQYTLEPHHIDRDFSLAELETARLAPPMDFTKGSPLLRFDAMPPIGEAGFEATARRPAKSPLFDLATDPEQENPLDDPATCRRLEAAAARHLEEHDAPNEIFAHYGLVAPGRKAEITPPDVEGPEINTPMEETT
ncbi:sulfatase [Aliiruegeria sabulilitoris]|uniref:sulfatase n=1 Tax=Aliiruegeria sabulilitoris TaxID=1510458 RepID=UPI0009E79E77|nr:sulfatase [Aliiruegeria sabulilitoris]NDR56188.1 sulfatase [Pseudoruegeria sp. M32A2M]